MKQNGSEHITHRKGRDHFSKFCFTCLGDTAQKDPRRGPTGKVGDISLSSPTTGERIKESLNGDYMSITKNGNLKSSYRKFIILHTSDSVD